MMLGKTQSKETIKKRTQSLKKYWGNPILREKSIQKMKKYLLDNSEKEQERRKKLKRNI